MNRFASKIRLVQDADPTVSLGKAVQMVRQRRAPNGPAGFELAACLQKITRERGRPTASRRSSYLLASLIKQVRGDVHVGVGQTDSVRRAAH